MKVAKKIPRRPSSPISKFSILNFKKTPIKKPYPRIEININKKTIKKTKVSNNIYFL